MLSAATYLRAHDGSAPLGPDAEALCRWTQTVEGRLGRPIDVFSPALVTRADESDEAALVGLTNAEVAVIIESFVTAAFGSRRVAARLTTERIQQYRLTAREAEVADMLLDRRTDREIADALYLSRGTVTTHVSSILRKIGVSSRREVAARLASADA